MARRVATLLSCCFAAVAATQGVPLEIVLSAVVFDGTATMDLNGPDNDAVQCLRAAIVAVLREEYSSAFVSGVTATSYVADGSTNTKVTFRVAAPGINAEYVRNDLLSAVVESSNSDSELMVALGDLAFRFPNAVEPWTEHLYGLKQWGNSLHDSDAGVRQHAITVLAHLVLNDMVKVQGQVAELTLCLLDSDERIAALAKLFFTEFAKKGTSPVYNLPPDIVSSLSSTPGLSAEGFREILGFLVTFIQKDKQLESMVEKLWKMRCKKLNMTSDVKNSLVEMSVRTFFIGFHGSSAPSPDCSMRTSGRRPDAFKACCLVCTFFKISSM